MRSVSAASSGVSVRRSSPFARTCVRCGERDRALRALLDEEDADPALRDRLRASRRRGRRSSAPDRATARRGAGTTASRQRPRDRELLLLAAGQRAGVPVAGTPRTIGNSSSTSARSSSTPAELAARGEAEPEVLVDRELREQPPTLRNERDPAPRDRLRRPSAKRPLAEQDVAGARRDEPHDRVQGRRLARSVRADETDDLARRDSRTTPRERRRRRRTRPRDREGRARSRHPPAPPTRRGTRRRRRGSRGSRSATPRRASGPGRAPGCGRRRP